MQRKRPVRRRRESSVGLSLYRSEPSRRTEGVHVRPWSRDCVKATPGRNPFKQTASTVPSFATAICGSYWNGTRVPCRQMWRVENHVVPRRSRREKADNPGAVRSSFGRSSRRRIGGDDRFPTVVAAVAPPRVRSETRLHVRQIAKRVL